MNLSLEAKNKNYSLEWHNVVDSTNVLAEKRIKEAIDQQNYTAYDKHFIVAKEQTKGRGRRGRNWYSPQGNLFVSLILNCNFTIQTAPQLSFVASLSLTQALCALAERFDQKDTLIHVKWPNDVLLNNGKIGGNLIEVMHYKGQTGLILGIGCNVANKYIQEGYLTSHLYEYNIMATIEEVFEQFSYFWAINFSLWQECEGHKKIKDLWLSYATNLGQEITIKIDTDVKTGIFETIDDNYRLVLRQKHGSIEKISSGDVFFGNGASSNCGN